MGSRDFGGLVRENQIMRIINPARALALLLSLAFTAPALAALPPVTVYKDPRCGCCAAWARYLTQAGFAVTTHDVSNMPERKQAAGVPAHLASCHTAQVGGYVVEGHVPAAAIERLLREQPKAIGIAVAGMPIGSPGMEGPNPEPYEVKLFDARGEQVFERY